MASETKTSGCVFNFFTFSENDLGNYGSLAIGTNVFRCFYSTLLFTLSDSYTFDKVLLLIANFNWFISFTKSIRFLMHELPLLSLMLYLRIFNPVPQSREDSVRFLGYLCSNFLGEIDCKQRFECVKMVSFSVWSTVLYFLCTQSLFFSKIYNFMDWMVRFFFLRKNLSFIYYMNQSIDKIILKLNPLSLFYVSLDKISHFYQYQIVQHNRLSLVNAGNDNKMIERMIVLGKELFFLHLTSIDVLNPAILQLQIRNDLVLTLLDQNVGLVELRLRHRALLRRRDVTLVIWIHLVGKLEILSVWHEGIEIPRKNYIILFSNGSELDQRSLQLLYLRFVLGSFGSEMHVDENEIVQTKETSPSCEIKTLYLFLRKDCLDVLHISKGTLSSHDHRVLSPIRHLYIAWVFVYVILELL